MNISDELTRLSILKNLLGADLPTPGKKRVLISVADMDDGALIEMSQNESLVVSSDFVRGPHFYLAELGYLNYFDLGYFLIVANLSDIAAMGASPIGLTTIVRYTKDLSDEDFSQVFRGIKAAADKYSVQVVGGDIGEYACTVLAATALGVVNPEHALRRNGASPGDLLCVTGNIGLPITAIMYFKEWKKKGMNFTLEQEGHLLDSWKKPCARLQQGIYLSNNKIATSCQDISDGLKATIQQISEASNCGFTVEAAALPIDACTISLARFIGIDDIQIAMSASVDFELLFTASQDGFDAFNATFSKLGMPASIIGRAHSEKRNLLLNRDGSLTEIPGVTWRQQTNDYLTDITKKDAK
ncbi:MAG TPA: thiamine-phosphate kinase [Candidatus Angelobacter sp.]|nr:thiamine-phosphate kinase [Candidatus Angelobacter sp.]